MFTKAASGSANTRGTPGRGKGVRFGRRTSRVRQAPEVYGETLLRLAALVAGQGPAADTAGLDDFVTRQRVEHEVASPASPIHGRDAAEIMAALAPRRGPERLLDLMLRAGPYGDAFGANPGGLSL